MAKDNRRSQAAKRGHAIRKACDQRLAEQRAPLPAKEDMSTDDPLAIPAFLKRDGSKRLTHAESAALVDTTSGRTRDWIMPDNSPEAKAARAAARVEETKRRIFVHNDEAPVTVVIKNGEVKTLAVYQSMGEFRSKHDFGTYPFKESKSDKDQTVILVGEKPWAGKERKPAAVDVPRGKSKKEIIGEMLLRPEGVTSKEVCDAMGWPSVSMPAQAKMVGLALKKEKVGGVTKYWGIKK